MRQPALDQRGDVALHAGHGERGEHEVRAQRRDPVDVDLQVAPDPRQTGDLGRIVRVVVDPDDARPEAEREEDLRVARRQRDDAPGGGMERSRHLTALSG